MTFDEYNTDDNYDNKNGFESSLEELVKIGKSEGKSKDEIKKALSPKWQKSSKLNKFDEYYGEDIPKEEPKVEEMTQATEALKPEEPKKEQKEDKTPYTSPLESEDTGIKQSDKNYMNETNAILNEEQKKELQKLIKTSADDYNRTMENMERSGNAFKKIDDKLIEQLPTFMFQRYQKGEFGDPKSEDAKLRLAYFAMNNVVSKLKSLANADAAYRGRGQIFADTESAYDKYQKTNLEQGLQNRWNKYKAETDSAIEMVKNRNMSEEDALNIINKISMNNRLQNAFNMADANKKAYMIEVLSKVGDKVSNWNDQKFINALIGAEMTGEDVGSAATLIGARAGGKILDNFNLIDENGNIDLSALKDAMSIPGFADKFKSQFGFEPTKLLEGGASSEGEENTETPKAGLTMNDAEFEALKKRSDELSAKYYNGEMSKEDFVTEWEKLYKEMNKHPIYKQRNNVRLLSTKEILAANKELELKDKFGEDTKSKTFKEGKKAVDYFNDKTKLFEYLKNTEEPNFIDAKAATKNKDYKMKEYQEALKQYEILKKADATNLVGKY